MKIESGMKFIIDDLSYIMENDVLVINESQAISKKLL